MRVPFLAQTKNRVLRGDVCSIRLWLSAAPGQTLEGSARLFRDLREGIAAKIRDAVLKSLGPEFEIAELLFPEQSSDVLLRISATDYVVQDYDSFIKALKLLVASLRASLEWLFDGRVGHCIVRGQWHAGSSLVRLQLGMPDSRRSVAAGLQQPLSVLLIGTLLGSVLFPFLNDRSNRNKLQHEERIKIAMMIVEQSHETDRRLSNLMNYLVLFRKDHNDGSEHESSLKKEQYNARKVFNEMYLSYAAQAWWWHWNVKSESSLSALATPEESKRVGQLATEYSQALEQGSQAVATLWDPFLKRRYNPANPENDVLITKAIESLTNARKRRNEVAVEMARVFASH